jgi:hypothetical protein
LCRYASGQMQGLLEIGMWWLVISTWKQSQPQSKQQEAKRKQKALDILASARRIGFEISHRTCLTTKQPNLFDHQTTELVRPPNTELVQRLPPFAPSQKNIYGRAFGSDFSFLSYVLLDFIASNQIHSHSHKREHWSTLSREQLHHQFRLMLQQHRQMPFQCLIPSNHNLDLCQVYQSLEEVFTAKHSRKRGRPKAASVISSGWAKEWSHWQNQNL